MHLRDDFSASGPVSQVPASWFNKVAKFINNLIPGEGVEFDKHDDGSPTIVKMTKDEPTPPTTSTDISGNSADDQDPSVWPIPSYLNPTGKNEIWAAGTTDAQGNPVGYKEDALVVVTGEIGSEHFLWHVVKEYSSDGRLLKVRKFSDGGGMVYVGA